MALYLIAIMILAAYLRRLRDPRRLLLQTWHDIFEFHRGMVAHGFEAIAQSAHVNAEAIRKLALEAQKYAESVSDE